MSGDVTIKTEEEIIKLKEGGNILATILSELGKAVKVGITTKELDQLARDLMKEYKVEPSFLNYSDPPYPAVLCTSVNQQLVHCIPSDYALKEGDIISLDCGIWHKGLCTDMARTFSVGKISEETKKLSKVTRKALEIAIETAKPGNTIGDLGYNVQTYVEQQGFSVVRKLVGHGVGYEVHEPPAVPNFGKKGEGIAFKEGMVLAFEPMVNIGHHDIVTGLNDWDISSKDDSLTAHFEDTIVITSKGAEIITK